MIKTGTKGGREVKNTNRTSKVPKEDKPAMERKGTRRLAEPTDPCALRILKVIRATCDGAGDAAALFQTIDTAREGHITPDMFSTFVTSMVAVYPGGYPKFDDTELADVFASIDLDNNGTIEIGEFQDFFALEGCPAESAAPPAAGDGGGGDDDDDDKDDDDDDEDNNNNNNNNPPRATRCRLQ